MGKQDIFPCHQLTFCLSKRNSQGGEFIFGGQNKPHTTKMVKSQIIFGMDHIMQNGMHFFSTARTWAILSLSPALHKWYTSAHQDKPFNAIPLKKNVKTCPVYGNRTTHAIFLLILITFF